MIFGVGVVPSTHGTPAHDEAPVPQRAPGLLLWVEEPGRTSELWPGAASNVAGDIRLRSMPHRQALWSVLTRKVYLKFDGHRECRDVPFEPILCLELLIVTKIENHRSVHQHRVVNEMGAYAKTRPLNGPSLAPEPSRLSAVDRHSQQLRFAVHWQISCRRPSPK